MDMNEKFTVARFFTNAVCLANSEPRALVATSARNTGIYQCQLDMVGRAGPSLDIIFVLRELGHNCWKDGMHNQYRVYFHGDRWCPWFSLFWWAEQLTMFTNRRPSI